MTSTEEKRATYSKMKSWADHCSSDEESDDELHPARLASNSNMDGGDDLSYESEGHISVTADDNLDYLGPSSGGSGGNGRGGPGGAGGRRGGPGGGGRNNNHNEEIPYPQPIDFDNLPPEVPKQPPYTAYIRNLCFKIQEPGDLADKVEGLTRWRYKKQHEVRVINARLGIDRNTGKRKGFGYVEFETPEELMLFLNLNDGFSRINGRDLVIDIANNSRGPKNNNNNNNNQNRNNYHRQNNDVSDIDGSQFRGGRFSKSNGGGGGGNRGNQNNNGPAPPTERRTLKLAPRSKPVEGSERSTSQSSIFGDAKPRDEQSWRKKKEEQSTVAATSADNEKKDGDESKAAVSSADAPASESTTVESTNDTNQHGNGDRPNGGKGGSGRGGRGKGGSGRGGGRGSGGRGGGKGRNNNNNRRNADRRNNNQGGKDADGWDEARGGPPAQPQQEQEPKLPSVEKKETKSTKVTNKFAAFLDDSDSESE